MKIPEIPPAFLDLFNESIKSDRLSEIYIETKDIYHRGKYIHWDKLKHLDPPTGLTHREWWFAIKFRRQQQYLSISLMDKQQKPFRFLLAPPILEILHLIDLKAGGTVEAPEPITNPDTKDRYYVSSLIEESITSSQLEGAATTRKVAKEMIRRNLKPRDTSERMIMNNYLTMKRIGLLKDRQLTPELVFDIHRSITEGTLDHPLQAGRFRTDEDGRRVVGNLEGQIFHDPPPCSELAERMSAMCDFANGKTPAEFIHPVIRSILLHFWLAYDHPFVDGNGRTARALFYWSMLRSGYWLCEYISISNIIRKSPAKYGRAYLYAETDDNDLTYFIDYHLKVIERAVQELHAYIERKTQEVRRLERKLHALEFFNQRQRAILGHALRHPGHKYTIDSHKTSHNVTHRTARLDLLELKQKGLFNAHKIGKRWYFSPALDIERKLENLADA